MSLTVEDLLTEEKTFVFSQFLNADALALGSYIAKHCVAKQYPVTIVIEKNNTIVYRYDNDGTSANNQYWITKKMNVVKRFSKSSAFITAKLATEKMSFQEKYGDATDYAVTPGAVPIHVVGVGMIGVIAVSGLDSKSDHQLIIEGMKYLLEKQKGEIICK